MELFRVYLEGSGQMPFLSQRTMHAKTTFAHFQVFSKISEKFDPGSCDRDKSHSGHFLTLIPLFFGSSFLQNWHISFLEG